MSQERIEIVNRYNERLVGILHKCNDKRKLVVVCHGFAWDKDKHLIRTLCEALNKEGFNCFRFDFSGCGESEGNFEDSYYTKEADDLDSIIAHFYEKGYQVKSVFGHSMGGTVTILEAAKDTRIKSVAVAAPRIFPLNHSVVKASGKSINELIELAPITYSIVENGKEHRYLISRRYLEDIRDINVLAAIEQIKTPLLILHGTKDGVVNIKESKKAFEVANEPKRFIEIEGADHAFTGPESLKNMTSEALRWLKSLESNRL